MDRKTNIIDRIGRLIPGYKGYVVREDKRNTDKKLLELLSVKQSIQSQIDPPDFSCVALQRAAHLSFPAAIEKLAILW